MTDSPTPAFAVGRFFSRVPLVVWLPIVSALLLLGFAVSHANAIEELLIVVVLMGALGSGHAIMRSRARRFRAEEAADRLRDDAELRARVGDCEQRRKSLAEFAQMAAHVAHEVRNPLNAIMLNSELLEEEMRRCHCDVTAEAETLLASIQREAERLQHLTDEYLAFARPPRPNSGNHNLNAIVDDLTHLVRQEAQLQGVTIETKMSHECPCGVFDPDQLKQATLNLVRNALQAMPGGGRLVLETHVLESRAATLSIEDTGPGIPEDKRCVIFEPFYTSKPTGTGLGLPLAAHIVRDHGGDITFENVPGGGARFTIALPPPDDGAGAGTCSCGAPVAAHVTHVRVGAGV